jgi:hypothetical protein
MSAVEAVVANGGEAPLDLVAEFLQTTQPRAQAALDLAIDLGLLSSTSTAFKVASPLRRFTSIPDQKAAVLRNVIESYRPFVVFRERLVSNSDVTQASTQTKTLCGLPAHRDGVKDTLISQGTYARALVTEGVEIIKLRPVPQSTCFKRSRWLAQTWPQRKPESEPS